MRGTVAKRLRRKILGEGYSTKDRSYQTDNKGTVFCTGKRPMYQQAKREYKHGG